MSTHFADEGDAEGAAEVAGHVDQPVRREGKVGVGQRRGRAEFLQDLAAAGALQRQQRRLRRTTTENMEGPKKGETRNGMEVKDCNIYVLTVSFFIDYYLVC